MNPFFRCTPEDEAWVKSLVCNPEIAVRYVGLPTFEYPGGLCDPSDQYDYVIITTEQNSLDYWNTSEYTPYNWESLMEKHMTEGLSCALVTKQDIDACSDYYNATPLFNDSQAHIREFCRDAYEDWETRYVLIGGDAEYMPARLMDYGYERNVDSDLYWSNLDNTFNADQDTSGVKKVMLDLISTRSCFSDEYPVISPQDVSNWLTKSFYYARSTDPDYLENGGFYGGDTGWSASRRRYYRFRCHQRDRSLAWPKSRVNGQVFLGFLYGFETWNA